MKKFIFLPAVFLVLVLKSQTSISLVGYHKQGLWLEEKNGSYGLRTETKTLVPYAYDLVLPALQEEFAFIVKGLKIGVYDIKGGKEIELTSYFNELEIYSGKDSVYYLLYNAQSYGSQQMQHSKKLVRDESGKIKIIESKELDVNIGDCVYRNGILRIDSVNFLHHFTKLDWIINYSKHNGEEQVTYSYTDLLQRSGVFSLAKKDFVIPAQFSEIEVPLSDNYYGYVSRYIHVKRAENDQSAEKINKSQKLNDLDDIYQYGLYSLDYKLIQAPLKTDLRLSLTGGFYKKTKQLEVFDEAGLKIISFHDSVEIPMSLIRTKDKIYLGYGSSNSGELEMSIYNYNVYNLNNEFIKKETFSFVNYLKGQKIATVMVTSHPDSFDVLYGVYDLERSTFLIPPVYKNIDLIHYKNNLLECDSGNCDYYYVCRKNKKISYFDSKFKPFYPKDESTALSTYDAVWSGIYFMDMSSYLSPVSKTEDELKPFIEAGIKIDVICNCYFDESYSEEKYYGETVATYKGLSILKVYRSPKETPTYGLYRTNDLSFILEPLFKKMEFDIKNNALKILHYNKTHSLLLERYFNEN